MSERARSPHATPHAAGTVVDAVGVDAVVVDAVVVDVVVVAWGDEPWLSECTESILASEGVEVRLWVVDNGSSSPVLAALEDSGRGVVCRAGANLGFAGGCNLAAAQGSAPYLALVNSDARVAPDALAALCAEASSGEVIATAQVLLADEDEKINSRGNPVHYLGMSWAGGLGEDADTSSESVRVASASGATLALSRTLWEELQGFGECFFTYCEDADLSLRAAQRGGEVRYVPRARSYHHYEFSRNPEKFYHLERNRLLMLLTVFETRTLWWMLPGALVLELAVLAASVREGWWRQKLRGWWWLVRNRHVLLARRRLVQQQRRLPDAEIIGVLEAQISAAALGESAALRVLNLLLGAWWRVVSRKVGAREGVRSAGELAPSGA